MNLDFSKVEQPLSFELIKSRVSDLEIFQRYCSNFKNINKAFCSELRTDKNPDCWIYISKSGNYRYRDYAINEDLGAYDYVQRKYNCDFRAALKIVALDFGILNNKIEQLEQPIKLKEISIGFEQIKRFKSELQVIKKPFDYNDFKYWDNYYIPLDLLQQYNISSLKCYFLYKKDKRYTFEASKSNPMYCYEFSDFNLTTYKIYRPFGDKKQKWTFSGSKNNIEGYDQLNLHGDLLIITKSMKDVLVLRLFNIDAISLQGEGNDLSEILLEKLLKRFKKIVLLYDNDLAGEIATLKLNKQYNIPYVYIPKESNCKDISDYIKEFGKRKTKILLTKLLNELT